MIDVKSETLIPLAKVPDWTQKHLGHRINRSTVHRWRTRGARGVLLETILVGGRRFTSEERLFAFMQGADAVSKSVNKTRPTVEHKTAEAALDAVGI